MPYKSVRLTWENLDVFAPPEDDIESPQQQDGKKREKHILNKGKRADDQKVCMYM